LRSKGTKRFRGRERTGRLIARCLLVLGDGRLLRERREKQIIIPKQGAIVPIDKIENEENLAKIYQV
jgi:hypothetical protein